MTAWTPRRPFTPRAAFLALIALAASANSLAQEPTVPDATQRALLREAQGDYVLDDGRTLKVQVGLRRLGVAIDSMRLEAWRVENNELLVSPDGMRRVRLYRNADGSVDRIALETDRVRS